jgi:hypothetical protein
VVGAVGFEPTISCSQSTCLAARPHPERSMIRRPGSVSFVDERS